MKNQDFSADSLTYLVLTEGQAAITINCIDCGQKVKTEIELSKHRLKCHPEIIETKIFMDNLDQFNKQIYAEDRQSNYFKCRKCGYFTNNLSAPERFFFMVSDGEFECDKCFRIENLRTESKNIFEQAQSIVDGKRQDDYGVPERNFDGISKAWSGILVEKLKSDITPQEVSMMMVALKLVREANRHKDDNIVDAAGYLILTDRLTDK
jgi:hypothetical protein